MFTTMHTAFATPKANEKYLFILPKFAKRTLWTSENQFSVFVYVVVISIPTTFIAVVWIVIRIFSHFSSFHTPNNLILSYSTATVLRLYP